MKRVFFLLLPVALSLRAPADTALGTLTVRGKTTILRQVVAEEQTDPVNPSARWLVILASDRKVEGDRSIAHLTELAREGKLHAVRILWLVGTDKVRAVPYDAALPESGHLGSEHPTIDLRRYGSGRVDAEFRSKMLGQDWHFHANVKAAVASGGVFELEPGVEGPGGASTGGGDKVALGQLGYEYTESSFGRAVADGSAAAVQLFLKIGMSPNAHAKGDQHPMILAASLCSNPPQEKRSEVLEELVAGGGDVKAKDINSSTPLLWAVQTGCSPSAVRALLKAGADPNAKAKAGATPLMFAEMFQRTEIAEMLRKAGAKK